jgi:hypothetical protein
MTLVLNGSVGVSDVDGSAATPAIRGTDANTGMFFPAADTIAFAEGGAEVMRIDSSGNVGIGTSSPTQKLDINGNVAAGILKQNTPTNAYNNFYTNGGTTTNSGFTGVFNSSGTRIAYLGFWDSNNIVHMTEAAYGITFGTNSVEQVRISSAGVFSFNSGYGSVAVAYGCRAWVNFNGTGTVAIRASGNVTSITDNGVGKYTVNFTSAMPDANYTPVVSAPSYTSTNGSVIGKVAGSGSVGSAGNMTTTALDVAYQDNGASYYDPAMFFVAIIR